MTTHTKRARNWALTVVSSLAVLTIAACASPAETVQGPVANDSSPAALSEDTVSGVNMAGHIHNLALDGPRLIIGTHEGLWLQEYESAPQQVSEETFDVMGFTRAADRWLASGHPGPDMNAPGDLGLMQSTDQGRTWTPVALEGEADLHRLVTSGQVVVGVNAHDGRLLRSDDGGSNWSDFGTPGLYDIAIDPADSRVLVGTTPDGPVRSTDGGKVFSLMPGAPLIALVSWTAGTLYGFDVEGAVFSSSDGGTRWERRGVLPQQPTAVAADGDRIAALVGDQILESQDDGMTFTPRIIDIPAH